LRAQDNNSRIISRWNNEELLLAVAGVRKFGKDFQVNTNLKLLFLFEKQKSFTLAKKIASKHNYTEKRLLLSCFTKAFFLSLSISLPLTVSRPLLKR
jgi:hypothetical protein